MFIDFSLMFLGGIGRVEHAAKFDVASAVFTRDMALYRELAPENLVFSDKQKRYEVTSSFKPMLNTMYTVCFSRCLRALVRV